MKLAIVGSRTFVDYDLFLDLIIEYLPYRITELVSGGAKGTDSLVQRMSDDYNYPIKVFPANWVINGMYDHGAGMKRNKLIVDYCDYLIAFWDGYSKGTGNSIRLAKDNNKLLKVITI